MEFSSYYANLKEIEGKQAHDPHRVNDKTSKTTRCVLVTGPVIVGVGPSGLAVAACLKDKGVPSVVLERAECIASLWKNKTYDRLCLHLPKKYCELPLMPFPPHYPTYPSKRQFVEYLEDYARKFEINPIFNETVQTAEFDQILGLWRVRTRTTSRIGEVDSSGPQKPPRAGEGDRVVGPTTTEYVCRWLVVATGENADSFEPELEGLEEFRRMGGRVLHTSDYKCGEEFRGKRMLVVGCGNSGMEVGLDLCNYNAMPSIVVRDRVHVLPREMFGSSTFGLSMKLLEWLPVSVVDKVLLTMSWFILGDTSKFGLIRPEMGPIQLKTSSGKTPVLDVGTIEKIRNGNIKVLPGLKRLMNHAAEFADGTVEYFDAVILATGYKSNVPSWLKEREMFSEKDGMPRKPFPNGWKGESGLYAVGFTKRGLLGSSIDARKIADDIGHSWNTESKPASHNF